MDKVANQDNEIQNEINTYIDTNLPIIQQYNLQHYGGLYNFSCITYNSPNCSQVEKKYNSDIDQIRQQSYFEQWSDANRPGYSDKVGFWEVYFMKWMMDNHPEFCDEYNPGLIRDFVNKKMKIINSNPSNQSSGGIFIPFYGK